MKIDGPLSKENLGAQFCSDWLKVEIEKLLNRCAELESEAKLFRERLGPAGIRVITDLRKDNQAFREVLKYCLDAAGYYPVQIKEVLAIFPKPTHSGHASDEGQK